MHQQYATQWASIPDPDSIVRLPTQTATCPPAAVAQGQSCRRRRQPGRRPGGRSAHRRRRPAAAARRRRWRGRRRRRRRPAGPSPAARRWHRTARRRRCHWPTRPAPPSALRLPRWRPRGSCNHRQISGYVVGRVMRRAVPKRSQSSPEAARMCRQFLHNMLRLCTGRECVCVAQPRRATEGAKRWHYQYAHPE